MATPVTVHAHAAPQGFIRKYIFSLDHKVIGLQYFFLALTAVWVGMFLSLLMRLHLIWPNAVLPLVGEIKPETYLSLLTMHGTIMVFFVLTTAPQGGFGNYFLPIQIGAPDMAFPVLNMLSFWTTFVAFVVMICAFFVTGGAPLHGWTGYAPLSALPSAGPGEQLGADLWITSIAIFCIASLMGALNFLTTTLDMRAKGMTMMRMPLTVWSWFITAILGLLAFGVLLSAGILLLMDRNLGTSFYVPLVVVNGQIMGHKGGSPLLWQHLFWFFGHPEVYVVAVPGLGIIQEILPVFGRKPIFGYRTLVWSAVAAGVLSFTVWAHHMFLSGMNPTLASPFSVTTIAISIPFAVMLFCMIATLWRAQIIFATPMLFALGALANFILGGVTGIPLGTDATDIYLHDTYFVIAHFHNTLVPTVFIAGFAGIYYWFPKMFGRMMNETWGKVHFIFTWVGFNLVFIPLFLIGLGGGQRRMYMLKAYTYYKPLQPLHVIATIGLLLIIAGQIPFLVNFFVSMFRGKQAEANPWNANTLEWATDSPPPHENFHIIPTVVRGPYEYSVPGMEQDWAPQAAAVEAGAAARG